VASIFRNNMNNQKAIDLIKGWLTESTPKSQQEDNKQLQLLMKEIDANRLSDRKLFSR
jgi:hypothetical protein